MAKTGWYEQLPSAAVVQGLGLCTAKNIREIGNKSGGTNVEYKVLVRSLFNFHTN